MDINGLQELGNKNSEHLMLTNQWFFKKQKYILMPLHEFSRDPINGIV